MEKWTPVIIVALPLMIGLIDVLLLRVGGNQATISHVALLISLKNPLVPLAICYSFAVLMGHLFFPAFTDHEPPGYEVVARMFVVLSPTIYAMIIIAAGNGAERAHRDALLAGGQWWLAGYMLVAAVLGGFAGKYGLPQHLPPFGGN